MSEPFEEMLKGGHPNSLGRTVEVVETVEADPARLDELYNCYFSPDEVVRLRTSNALKRVCAEHPEWLVPYVDGLLWDVARIDQASAQWTLAQLSAKLRGSMSDAQVARATDVLKTNLKASSDWIVLTQTMQTLGAWARHDAALRAWLCPELQRLSGDERRAVSGTATRVYGSLCG